LALRQLEYLWIKSDPAEAAMDANAA